MGVFQTRNQLGLNFETTDKIRVVGVLGLDHLNGDIPVDHGLESPVNHAGESRSEVFPDLVAAYGAFMRGEGNSFQVFSADDFV